MLDFHTLLFFYRRHLRVQPLRELMAVLGVAAGVALLFAVQIANQSVTGSFEHLAHAVAGDANVEVAARSPQGISERIYERVVSTPGVARAGPLLQQQVTVSGPRGSRSLTLVGADERIVRLGGTLVTPFWRIARSYRRGSLVVSEATAAAIGARAGQLVEVQLGGRLFHLFLSRPVRNDALGSFSDSPLAALPLTTSQLLSGLGGRVTRILVLAEPGSLGAVERRLGQRLGPAVNVRPISTEARLLSAAARPQSQVTALFGVIAAVVGTILAFNALQLAGQERRTFVSHLTRLGAPDRLIAASLFFDALLIGVAGGLLGLAAGELISLVAYRGVPGYLSAAFPLGGGRTVSLSAALQAVGAGIVAALLASSIPAIGMMRETRQVAGSIPQRRRRAKRANPERAALALGVTITVASVIVAGLSAGATVPAIVGFVIGITCCMPAVVRFLVGVVRALSRRLGDPALRLAAAELQESPVRSVALAATGVISVLVLVTIAGAVANVQGAVRKGASGVVSNATVWINPAGRSDVYSTQPFRSAAVAAAVGRVPSVLAVLSYQQSFLDFAGDRVWMIGVPRAAPAPVVPTQLVSGSARVADSRLREGGWAVVSQVLVRKLHLHQGGVFGLPTPSGIVRLRLAATISNYGWVQGTVLLNGDDYAHYWDTTRASELGVIFKRGIPTEAGRLAVAAALPRYSALTVETATQRRAQISSVLGSTLSRLSGIVFAVLVAALTSVVAMMVAGVWQRRGRIDALMSMGMGTGQLAKMIFYESGSILLGGCLLGLSAGLIGQWLIDRWLRTTTGSPVHFAPAWQLGLESLLVATAIASIATVIALARTVRFPPRAAFSVE